MKSIARRVSLWGVSAVVVLGAVLPVLAVRQAAAQQNGQAFSISPPLVDLKADPGQTVTAKVKLTNVSADELLIKTQFNDFGAKNETGEPNIIFDDTQSTDYSLRHWIASAEPFKLASKETKTLEFPINVPKDAEPGGHYAVVRFTGTAAAAEQNGVELSASIGLLVLLQVSGEIKEEASLLDFYTATPKELNRTGFFETAPISFVQRVQNSGNVHIKPTGTVEVINMFGQKVATLRVNGDPSNAKDQPRSVLPDSVRRFDQTLSDAWMFGRYEAKLKMTYGQSGTPVESTITFWVVPHKLVAIVLVVGTGLFFLLRTGIRRYNSHVVRKAQKGTFSIRK
ncbi:MAG: hypothetical protein ACREGJ_04615 [Candidatus Saccharimonadales bacterium]